MSLGRVSFAIGEKDLAAFRAKCETLELTQTEVIRNLVRQWVAVADGQSVVIPGDLAALLLVMYDGTWGQVIADAQAQAQAVDRGDGGARG